MAGGLLLAALACGPPATDDAVLGPVVLITCEGLGPAHLDAEDWPAEGRQEVIGLPGIAASDAAVVSLASLLSGLRPSQHGAVERDRKLHRSAETLATVLEGSGYRTRAWLDRAGALHGMGLARAFGSFRPLRSGRTALQALRSLREDDLVWIHVASRRPGAPDRQRVRARVGRLLAAAAEGPAWSRATVAVVGAVGAGARQAKALSRDSLEVPVMLKLPASQGFSVSSSPVSVLQVPAILLEVAGRSLPPAAATAAAVEGDAASTPALLSERYGLAVGDLPPRHPHAGDSSAKASGWNAFSLVRGDRRLLWISASAGRSETAPPLTGFEPVYVEIERWLEGGEVIPSSDEKAARELASLLHDAWLLDRDREEARRWRVLVSRTSDS